MPFLAIVFLPMDLSLEESESVSSEFHESDCGSVAGLNLHANLRTPRYLARNCPRQEGVARERPRNVAGYKADEETLKMMDSREVCWTPVVSSPR